MDQNQVDQLESLLTDQSNTNRSATNLYWNDQSEEIFLQDLFAGTLLTDDFDVNNNLNNLEIHYNPVISIESQHLPSNHSLNNDELPTLEKNVDLISRESTKNKDGEICIDPLTEFVLNLEPSFNLTEQINYDQNLNPIDSVDFLLNGTNLEDLKQIESLTLNSEPQVSIPNEEPVFIPEPGESGVDIYLSKNPDPLITTNKKSDDDIFKKPTTALSSFLQSTEESKVSSNRSKKNSKKNKLLKSTSENIVVQLRRLNNKNGSQNQEKILNNFSFSEPIPIKEPKIDNDLKNSIENEASSSENNDALIVNISPVSSSPMITSKHSNDCYTTSSSSMNKLFTLKRSAKRSKLLNGSPSSAKSLFTNINGKQSTNFDISQKLVSNKQAKLSGSKKISKKDKKEKISKQQQDLSLKTNYLNNMEPLSKKLAIDSDSKTNHVINDNQAFQGVKFLTGTNQEKAGNKEEVDLHIRELSLLDLHSSEDDSSERLVGEALGGKKITSTMLMKNSSNRSTISAISVSNMGITNPSIQKKMIMSSNYALTDSFSNSSINTVNDGGISSSPEIDEQNDQRQSKKYKKYWKKSSNDSDSGLSVKSSDSMNNKKKLKESKSIISLSMIDCNTPTRNSQNKRKKQSNNDQYSESNNMNHPSNQTFLENILVNSLPKTSVSGELTSSNNPNPSSFKNLSLDTVNSLGLDNDTLQHMKNLDLNQDLPKETVSTSENLNSTDSFTISYPSTSTVTSEKSRVKYIKGLKKSVSEKDPANIKELSESQTSNNKQQVNIDIDLKDIKSRQTLWSLLLSNSSVDEILDQFGSTLHDKISFWDLVQFKIKNSKKDQIKTIYEITDDYTKLYSNMSTLLEGFVKEHTHEGTSSRSRSSSKNYRKN